MSRRKLLGENEISTDLNASEKVFGNPISKYNYFVSIYNNEVNKVDGIEFKKMENSFLYKSFFSLIHNFFGKILLVLVLLAFPVINIFVCIVILICIFSYYNGMNIYKKNKKLLNDPFKNMVYSAELCQALSRNDYFFNIDLNGYKKK